MWACSSPDVMVAIFVFKAEDGIRDATVTGVQTCALPIWCPPRSTRRPRSSRQKWRKASPSRSEERRVGKEGRSRWSPDHSKKKKECTLGQPWSTRCSPYQVKNTANDSKS